jgi:pyruvate/2-oxoglutarate dehydrogenase complex dihydrolipoamide dehydrogenase (E3) component
LGGGPIGCELAQAFRRLGGRVTLVEAQRILGREDPEAAHLVRESIVSDGVAVLEGSAVVKASGTADQVSLDLADGRQLRGSHLLVAVGRKANVEGLGLDRAGVAFTPKGVTVDARLRTSNKRVFAIGDCTGGAQFTHVAGDHASTIVRNILFKAPARRRDAIAPRATYTAPELAAVGLSEADAKLRDGARVVRWSFKENDRAQAEEATEGFAKLVTDARGRILGATVVGENAGDLIHIYAFALANRLNVRSLTNYVAPYPTRGEIAKRLGSAWYTPALFSDRTRGLVRALATFD